MPWKYTRQKRYWRQNLLPRPTVLEFDDEFAVSPLASPFASPKTCAPGPGSWQVTDTDLRMTVAGGLLTYTAGPGTAWDRCTMASTLLYTRNKDRYVEFEVTPTNVAYHRAGWNYSQGGSGGVGSNGSIQFNEAQIYIGGGGFINVTDGVDVGSPLYPYSTNTSYTFRIYDTGTGFLYYVCPTSQVAANNAWVLIWERASSASALQQISPGLNNHSLSGTMSHVTVRQGLAKPPVVHVGLPVPNLAVDQTAPDGLLSILLTAPTNSQRSVYFRLVDGLNYWRTVLDTAANTLWLQKQVAGVFTTWTTPFSWHPGTKYLLKVLCFANHIRTFVGMQSGPTADDNFNQSAHFFGLGPVGGPGQAGVNTGDFTNMQWQTGGTLLLN